jgi:hypothetical protein
VKKSFSEKTTEADISIWLDSAIKKLTRERFESLLVAAYAFVETSESPTASSATECSRLSVALDCYDRSSPIPES